MSTFRSPSPSPTRTLRRRGLLGLAVILALSTTAACTSVVGGGTGALLGVLAAASILASLTATQTGCDADGEPNGLGDVGDANGTDIGPCLTPDLGDVGPCLTARPDDVGPCLGMPLEDVGPCLTARPDDVGPCLSPPWDGGSCLADVGPCLEPPFDTGPCLTQWDVGPCLSDASPADVGPCLSQRAPDALDATDDIGPCLSAPPPDAGSDSDVTQARPAPSGAQVARASARAEARSRLAASGALPPDVAARLADRSDRRG